MRKLLTCAFAGILGVLVGVSPAAAFPDRPVTVIVPWAAGGGTDMIVRIFAVGFEKELGVPINVVNQPGGNALTGNTTIKNAKPDGYTLGVTTAEIAYYTTLGTSNITQDDFDIFSRVAVTVAGMTVRDDAPFKNLGDFVKAVKEKPAGTYSGSGVGIGGIWHIALGGLLESVGLEPNVVKWVPSQGGAPALQEIGAGAVTLFSGSPIEAKSLMDAGRMRGLAVFSNERVPAVQTIPTAKEQQIDYVFECLFLVLGPKGIPAETRKILYEAAKRAVERPEVKDVFIQRGIIPIWDGPGEADAALAEFGAKARRVLTALGLGKK
jgi:tripartite-type tricarboxylate transporter receptor subunit TctC